MTIADTPAITRAAAPTAPAPDHLAAHTAGLDADARAILDQLRDDDRARAARIEAHLAYVADTVELRTPAERDLAAEVTRLRRDAESGATEYAHLLTLCLAVLDHWVDDLTYGGVHHKRDRLRALVRGAGFDGSRLADELDELGEHLGRVTA